MDAKATESSRRCADTDSAASATSAIRSQTNDVGCENENEDDAIFVVRTAAEPGPNVADILAEAEQHHRHVLAAGRTELAQAIAAGTLLLEVKAALSHGDFSKALVESQKAKQITFSYRTARRYMLVARHRDAPELATVANLREAERFISTLKTRRPTGNNANAGENELDDETNLVIAGLSADESRTVRELVKAVEGTVMYALRVLPLNLQPHALAVLVDQLSSRLEV